MTDYKTAVLRAHGAFRGQDPSLMSQEAISRIVEAARDPALDRALASVGECMSSPDEASAILTRLADEMQQAAAANREAPDWGDQALAMGFLRTAAANVWSFDDRRMFTLNP